MRSSVPAAGWIVVAVLVVAPLLMVLGGVLGVKAILLLGAVTLGFLVLLLLLGAVM